MLKYDIILLLSSRISWGGGYVVPFNNRFSSHHPGMVYKEDTERSFFMFNSEHPHLPQGPPEPQSGTHNYDLIVLNTFI